MKFTQKLGKKISQKSPR